MKTVPRGGKGLRGWEAHEWGQWILALGVVLLIAIVSALGFVLGMGMEDEQPDEPSILASSTSQVAGAAQTGAMGGGVGGVGGVQGGVVPAGGPGGGGPARGGQEDRVICVVFKIEGTKVYLQHISGKTAHNLKSRLILVLILKCIHLLLSISQKEHRRNRVGRAATLQELLRAANSLH
jgi:hypothetical protein